ncbi:MAG: CinA family protein [Methanomassiliicoccaceae archaeon]|nr:CinA family protein [Methanomassiliicoccaceae archaeon]
MMSDILESIRELSAILLKKGLTMSLAESCTGGRAAALITDVPGSSEFFSGCAVTYSNGSKEMLLNVSHETLVSFGAVSAETAVEMAEGALKVFRTDIAGSVTGIAGPGGGTAAKPVGTVFVAVTCGTRTECVMLSLKGSRDRIRDDTVRHVIKMLTDLAGEM